MEGRTEGLALPVISEREKQGVYAFQCLLRARPQAAAPKAGPPLESRVIPAPFLGRGLGTAFAASLAPLPWLPGE